MGNSLRLRPRARRALVVVSAAAMTLWQTQSIADISTKAFVNGNDLYARCTAPAGAASDTMCGGYIIGVVDTLEMVRGVMHESPCTPANITPQQVEDVVIQALRNAPEERNNPAAELVATAMSDAWCHRMPRPQPPVPPR